MQNPFNPLPTEIKSLKDCKKEILINFIISLRHI